MTGGRRVTEAMTTLHTPVTSPAAAVASVTDGANVLVGGWGGMGVPAAVLEALAASEVSGLTVVTNNCGMGRKDIGMLFDAGKISRAIASFPTHPGATGFRTALEAGEVELELVPQGTLVERLRCAGAGLGGFFTPTAAGTALAEGKEERIIDGRLQVFETALRGDVALIHAAEGDAFGNLRYRYAGGAFNATMAAAADLVIAEIETYREEPIPPGEVETPGIFVDRLVVTGGAA